MERRIQLERVRAGPSGPHTNTETRYRVLFDGNEIGIWRDPECSAARYLVDHGLAARDDILRTYRGDRPCMRDRVGWFADRRVDEGDGRGKDGTPRFAKWRPNPFAALRGGGLKPASDDLAGTGVAETVEEGI